MSKEICESVLVWSGRRNRNMCRCEWLREEWLTVGKEYWIAITSKTDDNQCWTATWGNIFWIRSAKNSFSIYWYRVTAEHHTLSVMAVCWYSEARTLSRPPELKSMLNSHMEGTYFEHGVQKIPVLFIIGSVTLLVIITSSPRWQSAGNPNPNPLTALMLSRQPELKWAGRAPEVVKRSMTVVSASVKVNRPQDEEEVLISLNFIGPALSEMMACEVCVRIIRWWYYTTKNES
jgi:hypothetical protein